MKKSLTILITGCGAPGTRGTLYAIKNNPDGVNVKFIGSDINRDVVGGYWVDKFFVVPNPENDSYLDAIASIVRKENVDIVIPQTTREIQFLSQHRNSISKDVS